MYDMNDRTYVQVIVIIRIIDGYYYLSFFIVCT
jgi:hypothetical protein